MNAELSRRVARVMQTPTMVRLLYNGGMVDVRREVARASGWDELPPDIRTVIERAERELADGWTDDQLVSAMGNS